MEKIIAAIIKGIGIFVIVILFSCLGGFIIWLIWPFVIPHVFPGLVESGTLIGKIDLIPAIFLTFLTSILIKSRTSSDK